MKKKGMVFLAAVLLAGLCGCGNQVPARQWGDRTVSSFAIEGLKEICPDEQGESLYCTVTGTAALQRYTMEGEFVEEIAVRADEKEPVLGESWEEAQTGIRGVSCLCVNGNILYCYRAATDSLMAVNLEDKSQELLGKPGALGGMKAMAAGENTLLLQIWNAEGKEELWVWKPETKAGTKLRDEGIYLAAYASGDSYWLAGYEENAGYYTQEYDAASDTFSEKYPVNLTEALTAMTYAREEDCLYGMVMGIGEYVRFTPRQADSVTRFQAQHSFDRSGLYIRDERLYLSDSTVGEVYSFDTTAYITDNAPLKGYVLDLADAPDYAGYNVMLEELSWDELALKVLAQDADYDFVILNTDMPEALALRDALAYEPIPPSAVEEYWRECRPCIREAALYDGEIWMLPLNLRTECVVYNEENLRKENIDMEQIGSLQEWYAAGKKLYEAGKEAYYGLNYPTDTALYSYIYSGEETGKLDFNTEAFLKLLDFLTGEEGYKAAYWHLGLGITWMDYGADWEEGRRLLAGDLYMTAADTEGDYARYQGCEELHARGIPPVEGGKETAQVTGDILILNPNAPNKEDVLRFAADVSRLAIEKPENWVSSDETIYPQDALTKDIFTLYEEGIVRFGLPTELFTAYYDYIGGAGGEAADVALELNRTVGMYLGE